MSELSDEALAAAAQGGDAAASEQLLRRYKNLVTILAAPPASLVKNDGIGESIVILICIVHACCLKMEWENLE